MSVVLPGPLAQISTYKYLVPEHKYAGIRKFNEWSVRFLLMLATGRAVMNGFPADGLLGRVPLMGVNLVPSTSSIPVTPDMSKGAETYTRTMVSLPAIVISVFCAPWSEKF